MSQQHLQPRLHLPALPATRPFIALWGGLAVLDLGRLAGASPLVQLAAITALVGLCSVGATRTVAMCVAAIGWLLVNGFVVHSLGQLGFVGAGDVVRAVLLVGVALVAREVRR